MNVCSFTPQGVRWADQHIPKEEESKVLDALACPNLEAFLDEVTNHRKRTGAVEWSAEGKQRTGGGGGGEEGSVKLEGVGEYMRDGAEKCEPRCDLFFGKNWFSSNGTSWSISFFFLFFISGWWSMRRADGMWSRKRYKTITPPARLVDAPQLRRDKLE